MSDESNIKITDIRNGEEWDIFPVVEKKITEKKVRKQRDTAEVIMRFDTESFSKKTLIEYMLTSSHYIEKDIRLVGMPVVGMFDMIGKDSEGTIVLVRVTEDVFKTNVNAGKKSLEEGAKYVRTIAGWFDIHDKFPIKIILVRKTVGKVVKNVWVV
jgi:hypothetical protein